jgi:hypothetical protein
MHVPFCTAATRTTRDLLTEALWATPLRTVVLASAMVNGEGERCKGKS